MPAPARAPSRARCTRTGPSSARWRRRVRGDHRGSGSRPAVSEARSRRRERPARRYGVLWSPASARSRDAMAMSGIPPNGPASVTAPSAFVASSSAANAAASSVSELRLDGHVRGAHRARASAGARPRRCSASSPQRRGWCRRRSQREQALARSAVGPVAQERPGPADRTARRGLERPRELARSRREDLRAVLFADARARHAARARSAADLIKRVGWPDAKLRAPPVARSRSNSGQSSDAAFVARSSASCARRPSVMSGVVPRRGVRSEQQGRVGSALEDPALHFVRALGRERGQRVAAEPKRRVCRRRQTEQSARSSGSRKGRSAARSAFTRRACSFSCWRRASNSRCTASAPSAGTA